MTNTKNKPSNTQLDAELIELKKEAKKLGVRGFGIIKNKDTLRKKIAEAQNKTKEPKVTPKETEPKGEKTNKPDSLLLEGLAEQLGISITEARKYCVHRLIAAQYLKVKPQDIRVNDGKEWGGFLVTRINKKGEEVEESYEVLKVHNHSYSGETCFETSDLTMSEEGVSITKDYNFVYKVDEVRNIKQ